MRLDNRLLVRWEYASEERFAKRTAIVRELLDGSNPEDVAFEAVAETKPKRMLDVGCGLGEFAERFAKELGADVQAIDTSARMIALTRARGIDAKEADAEQLPYADGEFDCVFAGWVLYHVPDLETAVGECARVLRPGGRLDRAHLAPLIPEIDGPFKATTRHVVFIAEKAG